MFSFGGASEEKLVIPPLLTALAQRTLGRVLVCVVLPIVLPNGDDTFWEKHEETVVHNYILSSELVQFEDIVIVVTVDTI